jgi:hypothetical protein
MEPGSIVPPTWINAMRISPPTVVIVPAETNLRAVTTSGAGATDQAKVGKTDVLRRAPYNASLGNRPPRGNRLPQHGISQSALAGRARHLLDKRPDQVRGRGRLLLELAESAEKNSDPWKHLARPHSSHRHHSRRLRIAREIVGN